MIEELKAWLDTLPFLECQLREEIGLYCPGCGGTRAVLSLLQGNIIESIKYNPIVVYAIVVTIIYFVLKLRKKLNAEWEAKYLPVAVIVGFLLLAIRTGILDYLVIVKGIHLI